MNTIESKNVIVSVDFAATPLGFFGRCVVLVVGMMLIIPAPWVLAWFFRWSFDQIRFSDNTKASFSGEGNQIWLPIMIYMAIIMFGQFAGGFFGQYAAFMPILSLPVTIYLMLIIYRWTWDNVVLSSGTKISFIGEYLPLLGWQLLISLFFILPIIGSVLPPLGLFLNCIVALITVAVWAWASVELIRWYGRNLKAKNHVVEFHGDIWNVIWRTVVLVLSYVFLIPIPWTTMWLVKWYVRNISIRKVGEVYTPTSAPSVTPASTFNQTLPPNQPIQANFAASTASRSGTTDDLWAQALAEYDSSSRNQGLWARLFSEAQGNEAAVKANYLRIRVDEMQQVKLLDAITKEQREYDALPRGVCPSCKVAILPTTTTTCPKCWSKLGPHSPLKLKIDPISQLEQINALRLIASGGNKLTEYEADLLKRGQ